MIDELLKVMALVLMVEIAYLGLQILRLCQEVLPILPRCGRLVELAILCIEPVGRNRWAANQRYAVRNYLRQQKEKSENCQSKEGLQKIETNNPDLGLGK